MKFYLKALAGESPKLTASEGTPVIGEGLTLVFTMEEMYDLFDQYQAIMEDLAFKQVCGSCNNFLPFHAEAGFCNIAEDNCICKNPHAMINMFDPKCEKHE